MSRSEPDSLLTLTQSFFLNYLRSTRGASSHTIRAYRDALKLFFLFLAGHKRKTIADLDLDDVQAEAVLKFLDHIESKRSNSAVTRNCRLAASVASYSTFCNTTSRAPASTGAYWRFVPNGRLTEQSHTSSRIRPGP